MAKTIGSLLIKLGLDGSAMSKGLKKSGKEVTTFSSKINKLSVNVGAALIAIGAGTIAIGRKAASAAINYEQLTVTFGALTGSAEKAKKVLADLDKFNLETPFNNKEIEQGATTLLNFGLEQKKLIPTMRMLGNLAKGNGENFQQLAMVYGQSRAEGKLMSKDIRQFIGANIPILKLLSEELGVAENQIFDMASKGKINFEILERSFQRATDEGGQFFGLMAKQSKTVGGLFSTLESATSVFFRKLGQFLLPALKEAATGLINIMNQLIGQFDDVDTTWGIKMAAGVRVAFDMIGDATKKAWKMAGGVRGIVHALVAMGKLQAMPFSPNISFDDVTEELRKSKEGFVDYAEFAVDAFGNLIPKATAKTRQELMALTDETLNPEDYGDRIGSYKKYLAELLKAQEGFNNESTNPPTPPKKTTLGVDVKTMGDDEGIQKWMDAFNDTQKNMIFAEGVDFNKINADFEKHKDILRQNREELTALAESYTTELPPAFEEVEMAAEPIRNALSNWLDKTAEQQQAIMSLAQGMGDVFMKGFDAATKGAKAFGQFMKQMLLDLIKRLFKAALITLALSIFTGGGAAFGSAMKAMGGFKSLIGLPKFAKGGMVFGPTMAMVGDNPNARTDPEIIAPLSKLKHMMGQRSANINISGVLRGRDIHLAVAETNYDRNRLGGRTIVF